MRIIGLGSDIVSVERIQRSLSGLGRGWAEHVLLPVELERAPCWDDARYAAQLFAAKEACSKALGTGMACGVTWHMIEIELPGKVTLHKAALLHLQAAGEGRQGLLLVDVFCRNGWAGALSILYETSCDAIRG